MNNIIGPPPLEFKTFWSLPINRALTQYDSELLKKEIGVEAYKLNDPDEFVVGSHILREGWRSGADGDRAFLDYGMTILRLTRQFDFETGDNLRGFDLVLQSSIAGESENDYASILAATEAVVERIMSAK